jgi:hypothetical protein
MDITLKIESPNNCGHLHVTAFDGKEEKTFIFMKDELSGKEMGNTITDEFEYKVKQLLMSEVRKLKDDKLDSYQSLVKDKIYGITINQ